MNLVEEKNKFEQNFTLVDAAILSFKGVDGFDVYNCSQPFLYQGDAYLFGRVERRGEWMRSWIRLFKRTAVDEWTLVPDSMIYTMEDPYISIIGDEIVMGGTHVKLDQSRLDTYFTDLYRGKKLDDLFYFTSGPDYMKDIRLVALADGRVGVFSRPRSEDVLAKYGSESMVGFTIIDSLADLSGKVIEEADYLPGLFSDNEWGGCNQAFLLEDGQIGVLGHVSFTDPVAKTAVYMNMSFVLNPKTREYADYHLIGTRHAFPAGPAKKPKLVDCAFTTGMVPRADGLVDLYSGLGDTLEGRTAIAYPFEGHGDIICAQYKIQ
ncbi:DUF1861 family protein [Lacticaseibacillus kribbianus]|uniref:DUF1861 family protein n=1 Tax=Lacticaseibacillus kribbianus TaxID=2926292 RepID=UPI001CD6B0D1|nr:DUF1861 family protein [Lacticaseibacillus kribbianus]